MTTWEAISCRSCGESLIAVFDPAVPAALWQGREFVHHAGYDRDTLEIVQTDPGHAPLIATRAVEVS